MPLNGPSQVPPSFSMRLVPQKRLYPVLGSTSMTLIRQASCPVMIVP